jgi:hypothetical protein
MPVVGGGRQRLVARLIQRQHIRVACANRATSEQFLLLDSFLMNVSGNAIPQHEQLFFEKPVGCGLDHKICMKPTQSSFQA